MVDIKGKIALACVAGICATAGIFTGVATAVKNVTLDCLPETGVQQCGDFTLFIDGGAGTYSLAYQSRTVFQSAEVLYRLEDRTISSSEYETSDVSRDAYQENWGSGDKVVVRMSAPDLPELVQSFYFPAEGGSQFLMQTQLCLQEGTLRTDYIAPLHVRDGNLQNDKTALHWDGFLEIPSDNDQYAEFRTRSLISSGRSFEAGVLYDGRDGCGMVLGSVNHDLWRSAVDMKASFGRVRELSLYCGATDERLKGDPHGAVSGSTVSSPMMMVGLYEDWREGMEAFAQVNLSFQPARESVTPTSPIGWNSWGSMQTDLNYDRAIAISDYVRDHYQQAWEGDGAPVYINLDSYWDNLSDEELKRFVDHCHANGQRAGAYFSPFVSWYSAEEIDAAEVPGTDGVTFGEIRLKHRSGEPYGNEVDGCFPLDVTHPATKQYVAHMMGRLKAAGIEYIKLDFLVQGSFEGDFYDDSITTGIQAYNYGMTYLTELLGKDLFINLAMSPTFPYQYANGRRLACDSYYKIKETRYTLNALTYGFWQDSLYEYTDPDHIVVWGKDGKAGENEARSRATSGVIAGTSFLAGDNLIAPAGDAQAAQERFDRLLGNADVMTVARKGKAFVPLQADGRYASGAYLMEDGDSVYLAVFNFSAVRRTVRIDAQDLGEYLTGTYTGKELWSGEPVTLCAEGFSVPLAGKDAALYWLKKE